MTDVVVDTGQRDGVVLDRGGVRWLDTREMDWQDWDAAPGFTRHRKLLATDDAGHLLAMLLYLEPAFMDIIPGGGNYRNIHKRIREVSFVVEGSLPTVEYATLEADGVPLRSQPGWFMDRKPGSLHGHIDGHHTVTGASMLFFANCLGLGPLEGNWVGEPSYHEESTDVPFAVKPDVKTGLGLHPVPLEHRAVGPDGILLNEGNCRRIATATKEWEEFPGMPGFYRKVLMVDDDDDPTVFLVYTPPNVAGAYPSLPYRHSHRTVTEWGFVVEGELAIAEYANAEQQEGDRLRAKRGWFFERKPGSIHGVEPGQETVTGSVVLYWRTGPGTWPGEKDFATETVQVPYP